MKFSLSLSLVFLSLSIIAQTASEIDSIEKELGGRDFSWVNEEANVFKLRKRWTKRWGLFHYYSDPAQLLAMEYDSVSFMKDMEPFSIVKKDGKYGRYLLPFEVIDAAERIHCVYDNLALREKDHEYYLLAQKNGKWALLDWFDEFEITPYEYDNPDQVPLYTVSEWDKESIRQIRKILNADIVEMDPYNGDDALRARNKETKLYGMYQYVSDTPTVLIPAQYDSLDFFHWNGKVTAVYKDGKVGFYTCAWTYDDEAKQTVACQFDDFEFVVKESQGPRYLAVKQNGKWAWWDWFNNKVKSEWYEGDREDLPYPYYTQEQYNW